MGERVPQSVQNLVLREYCKNHNLIFQLSGTEYTMKNSFHVLNRIIEEKRKYNGIIFYSLFQLPENKKERIKIFEKILKSKKNIYFALEDLVLSKHQDIEDIENIWYIKKVSPFCFKGSKKN